MDIEVKLSGVCVGMGRAGWLSGLGAASDNTDIDDKIVRGVWVCG